MPVPLPLLPLASWFAEDDWPHLPCGKCESGELQTAPANSIDAAQSVRDHPGWEPDWIHGHFHTSALCLNRDCQHPAVLLGDMKVDCDLDDRGDWQGEYATFLQLRHIEPPLRLIHLPARCPGDVQQATQAASRVLWADAPSAANRLRSAVESLLTALGVRKTSVRNRTRLSTHARIVELRATRPDVASVLEAVKWIGNAGSHSGSPTARAVLEAAVLLEHALRLVYDSSDKEIARLAKQVNKRKGRPAK